MTGRSRNTGDGRQETGDSVPPPWRGGERQKLQNHRGVRRQRRRFIRELWAVAQSQVPSERRPSAVSATHHTSTPVLVRSRKLNRAFSADVDRRIGVLGRWPRLADEPRRWRGNSLGEGPKTIEYRSLNGLSGSPGLGNTPSSFELPASEIPNLKCSRVLPPLPSGTRDTDSESAACGGAGIA